MSKIELALRRAQQARTTGGLPVLVAPVGQEGRPRATGLVAESRPTGESIRAIARMKTESALALDERASRYLIHPELADRSLVQVFRELRTKIIQLAQGRNRVILVTSVSREGGASFVSQNLAAAFALDEAKTALIIDCHLRYPGMRRLLKGESILGLTDYLESEDLEVGAIIHSMGVERLRLIPAGMRRELSTEHFTSLRMRRLIQTLRDRYPERFIFIDGPPMTDAGDIQMLAELCDLIVVVARYGRVTNVEIDAALARIPSAKLLGLLFNDIPSVPAKARKPQRRRNGAAR